MTALRKTLDALYLASGAIGALCLVAILLLIVAQMVARWVGATLPGATNFAGYCMAGSSFCSLAYALGRGAHIRVSLLLGRLGRRRRIGELWCTGIGAITASYFAWFAVKANYWSHKFGDISQGQDKLPLWIPQLVMSWGTILLAIALWDLWIRLWRDPAGAMAVLDRGGDETATGEGAL